MSEENKKRVLVLGAGGMLGNAMFRSFEGDRRYAVIGTLRSASKERYFAREQRDRLIVGTDVTDDDALGRLFNDEEPDIVVNCVGVIKQHGAAKDPLTALIVNALLPHRLAHICNERGARLVHVSTDCVFSGRDGNYREEDRSDADDLYGRTKYLGEIHYPHSVTLRTSIIGHELGSAYSLIDWFLSQKVTCRAIAGPSFLASPPLKWRASCATS